MAEASPVAGRAGSADSRLSWWSWPWCGLFGASLLWLGGAALAPLAADRGWVVAPFLYLIYQPICHQIPERSFEWWGHQSGACHRCVGLYSGFALGLLLWPGWRGRNRLRDWVLSRPRRIVWFALPLLVDVSLYSRNIGPTRFVTGIVAALPLALLALVALQQLQTERRRP